MRARAGSGTPADRRLVERYKPWDGAPWLLSAVVVLDDGRRLEVCQDLDGGRARAASSNGAEDGTTTDVAAEILTAGVPDASRWLGLDRAAFAAVALVDQAEHRAVRDAADGLQQYLRRAAETARGDGAAAPALVVLDRFLQERLGDRDGPLLLAQERCRWPGRPGSWRAAATSSTSPTSRPPVGGARPPGAGRPGCSGRS